MIVINKYLFRGKRKDNGEWVEGFLVGLEKYTYICTGKLDITKGFPMFEQYEVFPESVGMFTGITDKNNKKIFEDDLHKIVTKNKKEALFRVRHGRYYDYQSEQGLYGWYFLNVKTGDCNSFYGTEASYANVIGNVHDNPELLEV